MRILDFDCRDGRGLISAGSWTRCNGSTRHTTRSTSQRIRRRYARRILQNCECTQHMAIQASTELRWTPLLLSLSDMDGELVYRWLSMHFHTCPSLVDLFFQRPVSTHSIMLWGPFRLQSYSAVAFSCRGGTSLCSCRATSRLEA